MSLVRLIPEKNSDFFNLLIDELVNCDVRLLDEYRNIKINYLELDVGQRAAQVFLELPPGVELDLVESCFAKLIQHLIPELQSINCFPKIKSPIKDLQGGFFDIWPELLNRLQEYLPSSNGWLERARCDVVGSKITIAVESTFGFNLLTEKRCADFIRAFIKDELDFDSEVIFATYQLDLPPTQQPEYIPPNDSPPANESGFMNGFNGSKAKNGYQRRRSQPAKGALWGKKVSLREPVIALAEILDEERSVIVEGKIFEVAERELKSGRKIVSFSITDYSNSITGKIFTDPDSELGNQLKTNLWIRCQGKVQTDKFSQELILWPDNIIEVQKDDLRKDTAEVKRIELHAHTKMSTMDSVVEVADLVKTAIDWGHQAIAITDHGVVQAFPEAFKAANGKIKIIYGLEAYFIDDGEAIIFNPSAKALEEIDWVVFDVETTGFNSSQDEIIEIGAVKISGGQIIDQFSTFINPGKMIPPEITDLTGITQDMVHDAPRLDEIFLRFVEFYQGCVLVAHNASFDLRFLQAALKKIEKADLDKEIQILDTLNLSRALLTQLKNHKLQTVAEHLQVSLKNHHRALDDAQATGQILLKLLEMLEAEIKTLDDINQLTKNIDFKRLRSNHLCILVQNYTGLKNLYKLVSLAHLDYYYRHPRIPKSLLQNHREGLLLGTACEAGQLYQAVLNGDSDERLKEIIRFYDYVELQPVGNNAFLVNNGRLSSLEEIKQLNQRIYHLAKAEGKIVVATGDVHFLEERDAIFRKILMTGKGFEDANEQASLFLRTTEEMLAEFAYFDQKIAEEIVVTDPQRLAEMIENIRPVPEGVFPPKIPGAEQEIKEMTYRRVHQIYGENLPEIIDQRLKRELSSIIDNGYAVNYLIAHKLVKKSLDDGYLVGSRGSVGSSLVATMCQITEVNPMPPHYICPKCQHSIFLTDSEYQSGPDLPDRDCPKCGSRLKKEGYNIPFEVFMGFEGDKIPDIDLNFSGEYQSIVHKYTEELFGRDYVFRAGTISTVAERTAYGFVKNYLDEQGIIAKSAEINRLVKGCAGVRRTTGQHPGGLMIIPNDREVFDFCPIQYPANDVKSDVRTTHFDYHSIHDNLLKLDILGHDDPTTIRMLQDLTGVDPNEVPLDDPDTMALFSGTKSLGLTPEQLGTTVGTFGIPEFGTSFVRGMLEDTRPTTFAELVRISGLSHGTGVWLNNAADLVKNKVVTLAEVISVRDGIMIYLISKGLDKNLAFNIMESVRKGKGLKDGWPEIMLKHQIPEWYIESCKKITYMFPKAHAVAYVLMAFRIAYFKVHYPVAFYATHFSIKASDFDAQMVAQGFAHVAKIKKEIQGKGNDASAKEKGVFTVLEIVQEAMLRGIEFQRVDLYKSDPVDFKIVAGTNQLIPPFISLQGLGENAARNIALCRVDGQFISHEDLASRARLSKTVIETLKEHGALEGMPAKNQFSLFEAIKVSENEIAG